MYQDIKKSIAEEFSIFILQSSIFKNIVLLLFFILFSDACIADISVVNAKTDTSQIRIGEQFHLNLSVTILPGNKVVFPFLTDTFNHFEIVNKSAIDTISSNNQKELTLKQQLTLTSFDSGYFVIPPLSFIISENKEKTDTILSEAILISVVTVPVDTTKAIRAIKGIIDVPFPWQDYLIYLIIAAAAAGVIIYLIKRFGKKEIIIRAPVIPNRPAHEIALEGLKKIEEEKLWQQGFTKKYFSEVTEVIRQYIEHRFSFFAMEQTTDDILNHFANDLIHEEEKEKLRFILRHADMVKFAKGLSLPTENESTMQYAYAFINNTRPVIKEDFEKVEEIK